MLHYTRTTQKTRAPSFYVPMNFDPSVIPRGQRQFAAFFLNLLHWKWCCWKADERGYIRLKREYLYRVIPPEIFSPMLDRLVGKGIINWSACWTPSSKCQGYRLAPEYRQTKRIPCTNEKLARRIQHVYGQHPKQPVHRWLETKLELLEFDLDRAMRTIPTLKPKQRRRRKGQPMTVDEFHQLLREQCRRIADGDWWLEADKYGRVHTPVTSLPKELRCCLTVKGQRLVGLDLANSQPLIAGLVAREFYRSKMAQTRLRQRAFSPDGNPYHRRRLQGSQTDRPDLLEYLRVCEAGRLYESMMHPGDDRDRIKRGFLTAMYGENHWRGRLKDRLTDQYPSVAGMLRSLKRRNYKHASHVIQNAEATIFIHTICNRIRTERPDLPIYTVHDSIFTVPREVTYVRSVILDVFGRLGIHPKLKEENHDRS